MSCTSTLYLAYVAIAAKATGPLAAIRAARTIPAPLDLRDALALPCAASPAR